MSQIDSQAQKLSYVEVFHTPIPAEWVVFAAVKLYITHIAQCATDGFSIFLNSCVDLILSYKWSLYWSISEAGCKSYSTAKAESHESCWILSATAPPALSYLLNSEEVQTSSHTSAHSSMRHERLFDIIESMCRSIIGLQLRPKMRQFGRWVQKLFNCKGWDWLLDSAAAAPLALSYLLDPDPPKNNFLKNYPRAPL